MTVIDDLDDHEVSDSSEVTSDCRTVEPSGCDRTSDCRAVVVAQSESAETGTPEAEEEEYGPEDTFTIIDSITEESDGMKYILVPIDVDVNQPNGECSGIDHIFRSEMI